MTEFIHRDSKHIQLNDVLFAKYGRIPSSITNFPMVCPKQGAFIGYKVGITINDDANKTITPCLITLNIPEDAKRSSAYGNKCRCDKAKVLDIRTFSGQKKDRAISCYDRSFIYKIREEISVSDFDENRWHECAPGIHFFMTEREALIYWNGW